MPSTVFFVKTGDNPLPDSVAEAAVRIFEAAKVNDKIEKEEYVAVKFHAGDEKNTTHLTPEIIAALVGKVKEKDALPFLTETSTLYKGVRANAVTHIVHAYSHGFTYERTGAPFIMADGLAGDSEVEVKINGIMNKSVYIAREARMADFLLIVSHMTGHIAAGFGATLKNLGMGLSSRKGKLRQHSSISPGIIPEKCVLCRKCMDWCPKSAIIEVEGHAEINLDNCIGCGECLAVCRTGAIKYDWSRESGQIQQDMAEHALGVVINKKAFYINVCVNMTSDCDCFPIIQQKAIADIGVLGSWDPVALDQASLDVTRQGNGKNLSEFVHEHLDGNIQLEHAEKIGLGSRQYDLIEL